MPESPKLNIGCHMCHARKINKTTISPGGCAKTKNNTIIKRNNAQLATMYTKDDEIE